MFQSLFTWKKSLAPTETLNNSPEPMKPRDMLREINSLLKYVFNKLMPEEKDQIENLARLWKDNFVDQAEMSIVSKRYNRAFCNTGVRAMYKDFPHLVCTENVSLSSYDLCVPGNKAHSQLPYSMVIESAIAYECWMDRKPKDLKIFDFLLDEDATLMENFRNITYQYRLRFPYLLAGVMTGLEGVDDYYKFACSCEDLRLQEKLCNGLDARPLGIVVGRLRCLLKAEELELKAIEEYLQIFYVLRGSGYFNLRTLLGLSEKTIQTMHNKRRTKRRNRELMQLHIKVVSGSAEDSDDENKEKIREKKIHTKATSEASRRRANSLSNENPVEQKKQKTETGQQEDNTTLLRESTNVRSALEDLSRKSKML